MKTTVTVPATPPPPTITITLSLEEAKAIHLAAIYSHSIGRLVESQNHKHRIYPEIDESRVTDTIRRLYVSLEEAKFREVSGA